MLKVLKYIYLFIRQNEVLKHCVTKTEINYEACIEILLRLWASKFVFRFN